LSRRRLRDPAATCTPKLESFGSRSGTSGGCWRRRSQRSQNPRDRKLLALFPEGAKPSRRLWLHPFIIAGGYRHGARRPRGRRGARCGRCALPLPPGAKRAPHPTVAFPREHRSPCQGPDHRPARGGGGARLKRALGILVARTKAPALLCWDLELPRGASARIFITPRGARGQRVGGGEPGTRMASCVCVCVCVYVCVGRVILSIRGASFGGPTPTQRPAASTSEVVRSAGGCDKNRPLIDRGLEKGGPCEAFFSVCRHQQARAGALNDCSLWATGREQPLAAVTFLECRALGPLRWQTFRPSAHTVGHHRRKKPAGPQIGLQLPSNVQRSLRGAAEGGEPLVSCCILG